MSGTFQKFLFLGVLVAVTALGGSSGFYRYASPAESGAQPPATLPPGESRLADVASLAAAPDIAGGAEISGERLLEAAVSPEVLGGSAIFYPLTPEAAPEIQAQAALVADLLTGEVYFERSPDKRWPTASVAKLMTAVYAMRNMDPNAEIILTPGDFPPEVGDASNGLRPGETYRLKDLLQVMLLSSSNGAAEAVANAYGRDGFISGMVAAAEEWGLKATHFSDPTGLSPADQSSAADLRLLAQKIYENYPRILEITRSPSSVVTEVKTGRREKAANINLFAGEPGFLGGKTGYTDEAGGNLLSLFSHAGRPVAVVVLGTADRFGETEKLINWFRSNYRLNRSS